MQKTTSNMQKTPQSAPQSVDTGKDASLVERAAMKLDRAASRLRSVEPFFAFFTLHLSRRFDTANTNTAKTNGREIVYNPAYVDSLSVRRLVALIAHEVSHVAGKHCLALSSEKLDARRVNIATDHVINLTLKDAGFDVGEDWLADERFRGMSWREVYEAIGSDDDEDTPEPEPGDGTPGDGEDGIGDAQSTPQSDEDGSEDKDAQSGGSSYEDAQDEDGSAQSGGSSGGAYDEDAQSGDSGCVGWCGPMPDTGSPTGEDGEDGEDGSAQDEDAQSGSSDDMPEPMDTGNFDPAQIREAEAEIDSLIFEAAQSAKHVGKGSGLADRYVKDVRKSPVDLRRELRRFFDRGFEVEDYSMMRPNVRYLPTGVYLPSLKRESVGELAILVDSSGSVRQDEYDVYAAVITHILKDVRPKAVHVVYCDSAVRSVETFRRGERIELHAKGGGGTAFAPAFERVRQDRRRFRDIRAILYLTDGYNGDADKRRLANMNIRTPVLWLYTDYDPDSPYGPAEQPIGRTLPLSVKRLRRR